MLSVKFIFYINYFGVLTNLVRLYFKYYHSSRITYAATLFICRVWIVHALKSRHISDTSHLIIKSYSSTVLHHTPRGLTYLIMHIYIVITCIYNTWYGHILCTYINSLYSIHCIMYTVHCTVYSVQCTVYSVYYALFFSLCTYILKQWYHR